MFSKLLMRPPASTQECTQNAIRTKAITDIL